MILTRDQFWDRLRVRSLDLFPPALKVTSRTAGGQVISARRFGEDLWRASVMLAPHHYGSGRERRTLLALAQQPGMQVLINDPTYVGPNRTGVTLQAVASDNRTLTVAGLAQGSALRPGDYLSINQALYSVVTAGPANAQGRATIAIIPHLRFGTPAGATVELRQPEMLAVVENIQPATFEAAIAGAASFTIQQVHP
ncbi:hypothetical protein [Falsirhodobacter halotolerans]|uniref:hypothetical protein n=1 Tax=Falsirhodobacter halotolerans TaxID=1146892 RepID=UPI001FD509C1|nr:hypothetical protein [Falsirhodobacter halotolerans]MCJ8138437.1 hypothetical protein [Falsirhodobacter halotolerans]